MNLTYYLLHILFNDNNTIDAPLTYKLVKLVLLNKLVKLVLLNN